MVIAAHLSRPDYNGQSYLSALLKAQTASDRLVLFVDKKERQSFRLPSNAVVVEIYPPLKNGLLLRFWYRFKLPALLRQYQATVFFSEFPAIAPELDLPQSVFITDESMAKKPGFKRYFSSSFFKYCLNAEEIFIAGNHLRLMIPGKLHDNISLLPPVVEEDYKPLSFEEKDLVQKDFAGNRDYFLLHLGHEHNHLLITVLKGFSRFKKWQKSSFRLVVLTSKSNAAVIKNIISSYKYREEIHIYSNLSLTANAQIVASAFAVLHLAEKEINVKALLQCAACEVPQLIQKTPSSLAIMNEAGLFFELTEEDIMRSLQEVHKNERMTAAIKERAKHLILNSASQLTAFLHPAPSTEKL